MLFPLIRNSLHVVSMLLSPHLVQKFTGVMDTFHGISRLIFILLPEFPVYFHVVLKISRLSSIDFHTKNVKFTINFQIKSQLENLYLVMKLWKSLVSMLFTGYFLNFYAMENFRFFQ